MLSPLLLLVVTSWLSDQKLRQRILALCCLLAQIDSLLGCLLLLLHVSLIILLASLCQVVLFLKCWSCARWNVDYLCFILGLVPNLLVLLSNDHLLVSLVAYVLAWDLDTLPRGVDLLGVAETWWLFDTRGCCLALNVLLMSLVERTTWLPIGGGLCAGSALFSRLRPRLLLIRTRIVAKVTSIGMLATWAFRFLVHTTTTLSSSRLLLILGQLKLILQVCAVSIIVIAERCLHALLRVSCGWAKLFVGLLTNVVDLWDLVSLRSPHV